MKNRRSAGYLYKVLKIRPPEVAGHFYYGIRTCPYGKVPSTDTT